MYCTSGKPRRGWGNGYKLGTCDLTTKNKDGTLSLATQHSETSKNIFEQLQKFKLLLQPYPNSRITFIEIPHYSITKWNSGVKKSGG
jgi:hypothetical protein